MITVDMDKVEHWYVLMPDVNKVVDMVKSHIPSELRGNDNIVGNTLYMILYQKTGNATKEQRIALQEFLFKNYRINGILDESTSIDNILENADIESAYKYFKDKGEI